YIPAVRLSRRVSEAMEHIMIASHYPRKLSIGLVLLLGLLPSLAAQSPDIESVKTIKLTGPAGKRLDHMALDAKRDRLFVANTANSSLDVVDLKQGKVLKSVAGQDGIQGVVYVPGADRVVATLETGLCNIFDGDSYKLLKSLKAPGADNPLHDPRSGI